MSDLSTFLQKIDLIFLAVILIVVLYWGSKYFTVSKNKALNFLAFATVFGLIWLPINYHSWAAILEHAPALFLTYLFGTSFYELIAKKLFEVIEGFFGKQTTTFGNEFERDSRYYPTKDDFPATGEDGILYYDASTDLYWEWKNGQYIRWVGPRPPKPPKPF